jgi:hypothetical protein
VAITRFRASSIKTGEKYVSFDGGLPNAPIIGTATDGGTGTSALVAFTANNTAGLTYTALSNPDSLTASSTLSPITVTGLTTGAAYTFTVKATNSAGDSPASAASNSVTPVSPTSYESIATAVGTGSSGTITFSSIPSTYKHLQVRVLMRSTNTGLYGNAIGKFSFNGDVAANYSMHTLLGNGSTVTAYGYTTSSGVGSPYIQNSVPKANSSTGIFSTWIIDIHDYASTTKNKTARVFTGVNTNNESNTNEQVSLFSALWLNTAAINSVSVSADTAIATGSVFSLYGIKGE